MADEHETKEDTRLQVFPLRLLPTTIEIIKAMAKRERRPAAHMARILMEDAVSTRLAEKDR